MTGGQAAQYLAGLAACYFAGLYWGIAVKFFRDMTRPGG